MFRDHVRGPERPAADGAATLSLGLALHAPRLDAIARTDLIVDLGADIGTRRWWRGLATCLGLCAFAGSFAPGFHALDVPLAPPGEAQMEEMRGLAIAPLAYGADTGRRMAATDRVEPLADTPERPQIDLAATLGRGDGFARVLERNGVSPAEAKAATGLVADAVSLATIPAGTRVELTLGRRASRDVARPLDHLAFRAAFDLRLTVERVNGALILRRMPIAVDHTPLRVQGRVGGSLYRAARAAGAPAAAIEAYLKAIGTRTRIAAIPADARFDIIVEQRRAETGEVETGSILLAGLEARGRPLRMMKWSDGGRETWFDATGTGETRGAMTRPVYGRATSGFGMRRHPLLGFTRFHKGMDFGAPSGSPIFAATDGVVAYAGWHGGHGNYVMLKHPGGMATAYGHMSRVAARAGTRVAQGQVIGYVGSTGLSTGPHLHYEVYRNGQAINPATVAFTSTARLAGAALGRFRARMSALLDVRIGGGPAVHTAGAKPAPTHG